jgi:hypothetical protein
VREGSPRVEAFTAIVVRHHLVRVMRREVLESGALSGGRPAVNGERRAGHELRFVAEQECDESRYFVGRGDSSCGIGRDEIGAVDVIGRFPDCRDLEPRGGPRTRQF